MQKVISLLVATLMLLQMAVGVAADSAATISVSSATVDAGETVDVTIDLASNPGLLGMVLVVDYPEEFTLENVAYGDALADLDTTAPAVPYINPVKLAWDGLAGNDTSNGNLATLTFSIPENTINGEYDVVVALEEGSAYDDDFNEVEVNVVNAGTITVENGAELPSISVSDAEVVAGNTVDVTIDLASNPGILGMILTVDYPAEFTLENVVSGNALSTLDFTNPAVPYINPVKLAWDGIDAEDTNNGTLATLTFSVPEATVTGEYDVVVTFEADDIYDNEFNPVEIILVNEGEGTVSVTHEHNYTSVVTKEASCVELGVLTYTCACGHTYTEEIALADHTWGEVTVKVEPTCTTDGEQSATCKVCGVSDAGIVIPATGHTFDEGVVTKEATCKEAGEKTFTCEVCGETVTEAVAKLAHTYSDAVVVEPTCTEAGSKTYTCTACGEKVTETLKAPGHTFGEWEVVEEATEDEEGLEQRTCSVCGAKETREIEKVEKADDNKWSYLVQSIRRHALRQQKANKDNVKVEVEEVEEEPEVIDEAIVEEAWVNPFVDIFESDSYYAAIEFVYENGLFKGVSEIEFAPETTMTRAMFVTVLGRIHGITEDYVGENTFADVVEGEWYAPYVVWAADNGIVLGYGDGFFGINDEITVEQAAVILARYAAFIELDVVAEYDLAAEYADAADVAEWAAEAMAWAVSEGIYTGVEGYLVPQAPAARALVATMLYNFAN